MHPFISRPARQLLNRLDLLSLIELRRTGPLLEDGWFRSFRERAAVDAQGAPIPWFTYPSIAFLRKRVRPEMTVFEYGCGNSTLWWSRHVAEVVSCEHDAAWFEQIKARVPQNVTLYHEALSPDGPYARKAAEINRLFDVVVIDGRDRVNCARYAVKALKPEGLIIWDNSDREDYVEGYRFLEAQGFRKIEFEGFHPIVKQRGETAIFYRPGNCFGI